MSYRIREHAIARESDAAKAGQQAIRQFVFLIDEFMRPAHNPRLCWAVARILVGIDTPTSAAADLAISKQAVSKAVCKVRRRLTDLEPQPARPEPVQRADWVAEVDRA